MQKSNFPSVDFILSIEIFIREEDQSSDKAKEEDLKYSNDRESEYLRNSDLKVKLYSYT